MKRIKVTGMVLLFIITSAFFMSCSRKESTLLKDLEKTENISGKSSRERIASIKKGLDRYQKEAERTVKASAEIGIYYRMLGLEYMRLKMYAEALESFKKAIHYYPENPVLFYYAGVCAGKTAQSKIKKDEKMKLFTEAAAYYKRAAAINTDYTAALFAQAVLDVFEFSRPYDAVPLLERIIKKEPSNTNALFLLARADVMLGKNRDAVDLYNKIVDGSGSEKAKNDARTLRDSLLGGGGT